MPVGVVTALISLTESPGVFKQRFGSAFPVRAVLGPARGSRGPGAAAGPCQLPGPLTAPPPVGQLWGARVGDPADVLRAAWRRCCHSFTREGCAPSGAQRGCGSRPAGCRPPPPAPPPHRPAPLCPQGSEAASKGDFLFSSDHLIEMATKLYRTTLSQTRQKLNIEISDEYVRAVLRVPSSFRFLVLGTRPELTRLCSPC